MSEWKIREHQIQILQDNATNQTWVPGVFIKDSTTLNLNIKAVVYDSTARARRQKLLLLT